MSRSSIVPAFSDNSWVIRPCEAEDCSRVSCAASWITSSPRTSTGTRRRRREKTCSHRSRTAWRWCLISWWSSSGSASSSSRGPLPQATVSPAKENGDSAYLTIKGLRDLVSGLLGLALLAFSDTDAAAWFMLVIALTPLGDTVIVLRNGGTRAVAFGIHLATAVAVLVSAALLFAA